MTVIYMELKERTKQDLIKCIYKIKDKTFDETDISNLFISLRPFFKEQNIIWEIACFIAHVEHRNQGICHESLDRKYSRMKYGFMYPPNHKPAPLEIDKIEKNIFESLIIGSIEDFSENIFLEKFNQNKKTLKKYINNCYEFDKKINLYLLKDSFNNFENQQKIKNICETACGTVNFDIVIKNDDLIAQLIFAFKKIAPQLNLKDIKFDKLINENRNDLIVCVMCLLHSSTFLLYDKNEGRIVLSINQELDREKNEIRHGLRLTGELTFPNESNEINFLSPKVLFGIMQLDCDIENYFPYIDFSQNINISELPYFNAFRDEMNNLIIKNNI